MKTSKPKKTKKPKKVAVFYPTNGLTKEEINRRMLQKYSGKIEHIKSKFEDYLNGFEGMMTKKKIVNTKPEEESINDYKRLIFGYAPFGISGGKIDLISQEAFNIKKNKKYDEYKTLLTYDHIFGCLLVGGRIIDAFIKSGYDVDYMVNEWLPKHLYLWASIQVTKKEHSVITSNTNQLTESENPNPELEYNQKRNMEHYKGVSDIGFLVKE
jgi:hypothetical protein